MKTVFTDSDRHCPRDGKRLVVDVGQHESEGDLRALHVCLHCNYSEDQRSWSRPLRTDGQSAAKRLERLRLGEEVPLVYDTEPWPEEVW